jgi:hypothetical protein
VLVVKKADHFRSDRLLKAQVTSQKIMTVIASGRYRSRVQRLEADIPPLKAAPTAGIKSMTRP